MDGGLTWTLLNPHSYLDFNKVFFVSTTLGFAGGEDGLLKTTDGGATWTPVTIVTGSPPYISDIYFVNANTGYVLTGSLYKTTDGGTTWTKVNGLYGAEKIYYISSNTFLVSYSGTVMRTTDGGSTWNTVLNNSDGVAFYGQNGFSYSIYHYDYTTNGGATWTTVNSPPRTFNDVAFYDALNGIAVGDGMNTYKTSDGGHTWSTVSAGTEINLRSLCLIGATTAVAVGDNATIIKSTNSGTSWQTISQSSKHYPIPFNEGIQFLNNNELFVVGESGKVTRSPDGGATWQVLDIGSAYRITTCFFLDHNTGFVAGYNHIYKTTNAGVSWTDATIPGTTYDIYKIGFVNADTGIAVGHFGLIARTTDGGASWNKITVSNFYDDVYDLYFMNDSTAIITANNGFMKTTDAGSTWTKIGGPFYQLNMDIDFPNKDTGYIAGHNLLRSVDKGATWTLIENGVGACSNSFMKWVNGKIGYSINCGTTAPSIYRTMDGNVTFTQNFDWHLFSTAFWGIDVSPDGKRVVVITEDGFVLVGADTVTQYVGIHEPAKEETRSLRVVPNPMSSSAQVYFNEPLKDATIYIFNTVGQLVKSIAHVHGESAILNRENLNPGLYIYEVAEKEKNIGSGKLVIIE